MHTHTHLLKLDTIRVLQLCEGFSHNIREVHIHVILARPVKLIVARVHDKTSEEVRPCDVIHGILLGGDGTGHYLCIHVVC